MSGEQREASVTHGVGWGDVRGWRRARDSFLGRNVKQAVKQTQVWEGQDVLKTKEDYRTGAGGTGSTGT